MDNAETMRSIPLLFLTKQIKIPKIKVHMRMNNATHYVSQHMLKMIRYNITLNIHVICTHKCTTSICGPTQHY